MMVVVVVIKKVSELDRPKEHKIASLKDLFMLFAGCK